MGASEQELRLIAKIQGADKAAADVEKVGTATQSLTEKVKKEGEAQEGAQRPTEELTGKQERLSEAMKKGT